MNRRREAERERMDDEPGHAAIRLPCPHPRDESLKVMHEKPGDEFAGSKCTTYAVSHDGLAPLEAHTIAHGPHRVLRDHATALRARCERFVHHLGRLGVISGTPANRDE